MNSVWVSIPKGHSHHLATGNTPSCSLSLKNMSKRCFLETSILSQSKSTPKFLLIIPIRCILRFNSLVLFAPMIKKKINIIIYFYGKQPVSQ